MKSFLEKHQTKVLGVLHCFDRVIIRGHLPMASPGYFRGWLFSRNITLNWQDPPPDAWNFKDAMPWFSKQVKARAVEFARAAGRPYEHLTTSRRMEEEARAMAEKDGIQEGLVCVYGTNETCRTFRVRFGKDGPVVGPDFRVCLVIYYYFMDREYGLMHVKVQTWAPFTVQVYVNGHEWLARKLTAAGMAFRKVDNTFTWLADVAAAQKMADQFWRRDWPKLLDRLAERVNPLLADWLEGQSYYWVIDQGEYSTDVLFKSRTVLEALRLRLYEHAALCFSAPTLMSFLGRRYRESFAGEIKTKWHRREPGCAVRHWIKRNALKAYDKDGTVLRIETVINDPREFFVYRPRHKMNGKTEWGWFPMNKGVANLRRYAYVSRKANERYLEALAVVDDLRVGQKILDRRCAPVTYGGRRRRPLQPLGREDQALFLAVLRGEYAVRGFRNRELAECLFGPKPKDVVERLRRCGRVCRLIGLLRAHGLIAKIPRSRRYRVTSVGHGFMSTAIHLREKHFPAKLTEAA